MRKPRKQEYPIFRGYKGNLENIQIFLLVLIKIKRNFMTISMKGNKETRILSLKKLRILKIMLTNKSMKPLMEKTLQLHMKMKQRIYLKLQ